MSAQELVAARLAPPGRLGGIDTARGIALFGMMMTHTIPLSTPAGDPTAATFWAGKASALFAVLAGISIILSTRRTLSAPGFRPWLSAALALWVRGLLIVVIGLFLGSISSRLAIILVNYGVMFVIASLFLRLRWWLLGPLAAVWFTVTPFLSHAVRLEYGLLPQYVVPGLASIFDPAWLFEAIVLTGYYPVLQWLGYVFAGMALAAVPWHRLTPSLCAAGAGLLTAAAALGTSAALMGSRGRAAIDAASGPSDDVDDILLTGSYGVTPTDTWWWLASTAPHSATPLDLWYTAGTALTIIGLCSAVAAGLGRHTVWLAPLSAPGSMPLTVYSGHVVLLEITGLFAVRPWPEYILHVVLAVLFALVWRSLISARGPLESVVSTASHAAGLRVRPAPAA